jgi:hypothetical protein
LEFGRVAGLEGGDLGDGGFVSVFPFRLGAGWWEGAAEFAGEVAVGAFEEGVGGFGGVFIGWVIELVLVTFQGLGGVSADPRLAVRMIHGGLRFVGLKGSTRRLGLLFNFHVRLLKDGLRRSVV